MRVLYLTMNPNRASTTTPTEGWFRVLRERGLAPVVVSKTVGAFHAWAAASGIPVYHVDMPLPRELTPMRLGRTLFSLWRIVKRHRIDLVHCNEQDVYPVGQRLAALCGIPVAVSVHCTMDRGFCEWAFAGSRVPAKQFFVSDGNLEACRPGVEGVVPEDRWRVLLNGLDLTQFQLDPSRGRRFRIEHGLSDRHLLVGVACALRPWKQLEHLFEAASRLDVEDMRVVIAGGAIAGDEEYAAGLLKNARARLGDRLIALGHLNEMRDFLNGLDVFVNTSREEACSISVIESLACGCPVLGYPSSSVAGQILPDGGEIVPQNDVEALSAALARWLADSSRLRARRLGARRTAEARFDIRTLAAQLWTEYETLLQ